MAAMSVRLAALSLLATLSGACECPNNINAVFADMHDGDQKEVTIDGTSLQIKPHGNDQKWQVTAVLDVDSCSAMIDFNVPGKPNPPPVKLLMTLWCAGSKFKEGGMEKATFEFSDPSGKLAPASSVLNTWVELGGAKKQVVWTVCPILQNWTFADMHDGDQKLISVANSRMIITSTNSSQTWVVKADLDEFCGAMVNFHVPGKPSPPPVPLAAHFWRLSAGNAQKMSLEFTDPSGTLAVPGFPLNSWIQMARVISA